MLYVLCLYQAQISGERLQDHWYSGLIKFTFHFFQRLTASHSIHKNFQIKMWVSYFTNYNSFLKRSFKVLTRVWALYHRSKSLCLLLSTNKKPDFSDAQSYMRYLSEDLFSPI